MRMIFLHSYVHFYDSIHTFAMY